MIANFGHKFRSGLLLSMAAGLVYAESTSRLTGRIIDPSDQAVLNAEILVRGTPPVAASQMSEVGATGIVYGRQACGGSQEPIADV